MFQAELNLEWPLFRFFVWLHLMENLLKYRRILIYRLETVWRACLYLFLFDSRFNANRKDVKNVTLRIVCYTWEFFTV